MMKKACIFLMRLCVKMESDVWGRIKKLNKNVEYQNLEIFSYNWQLKLMEVDTPLLKKILMGAYKEYNRRHKDG